MGCSHTVPLDAIRATMRCASDCALDVQALVSLASVRLASTTASRRLGRSKQTRTGPDGLELLVFHYRT